MLYYKGLAEEIGFEVAEQKVHDQMFFLRLKK